MDIGRSIQYVFQDPNWIKKVLIGGLLFFIPIIGWLLIGGYIVRSVQNVLKGADTPLPEWDDWGDDLVRGLKLLGAVIIWYIPVWVLQICVSMLGAVDDGVGTGMLSLVISCVTFLLSIAVTFVIPLVISRVARNENIAEAFQFGEIIQEAQRIPTQLLIYVVMSFVIGFLAWIGLILCVVGVVFTFFLSYLILAHLIGQIRVMLDGGTPGTPPEPVTEPPPAM